MIQRTNMSGSDDNTSLRRLARMGSRELARIYRESYQETLARIAGAGRPVEIRLPRDPGGSVVLVDPASEEAEREFERANQALQELGQWDGNGDEWGPEDDDDDDDDDDTETLWGPDDVVTLAKCRHCGGTGSSDVDGRYVCDACEGTGEVQVDG